MGNLKFNIAATDGKARTGILKLEHGEVKTPELMPVATRGCVKALTFDDLIEINVQLIICNTYHLMLQPGTDVVAKLGGLHKLIGGWNKPLVTDSGGFQAFSLGFGIEHGSSKLYFPEEYVLKQKLGQSLAKITENGIHFKSVYDNSKKFLSPELSISIQERLGADMILALDECTSPLHDKEYTAASLDRTHRWAQRCIDAHKTNQALVGIVQGGEWEDLRKKGAKYISSLPFDGLAIGGSLGKSKKDMYNILDWVVPLLPEEKPRHLLGIGVVEDLFEAVERGVDLFDCVAPTRMARFGYVYVNPPLGNKDNKFKYKISAKYAQDSSPLDPNCECKVCERYSRGYIYHLTRSNELLVHSLMSYHNIHFFVNLMQKIRNSIEGSKFSRLKNEWGL